MKKGKAWNEGKAWKPDGRTFDQMAADLQRAADRASWEAWVRLWRYGDYASKQGRLTEEEEDR
jgi:hypothetical protein